jgi:hypothetical protein
MRLTGKTGASNRNVPVLAREDFDLAVPDVARETSDAGQRENAAEKRMRGISDGNLAFAFLGDQRGIALVGVCQFLWVR